MRSTVLLYFLVLVVVDGFCPAGEYMMGETCNVCPSGTTSLAASNVVTDCTCLLGYMARSDGVTCHACEMGTFKNTTGSGGCFTCPTETISPEASTASTDCKCRVGFGGVGQDTCSMCAIGKFKDVIGNGLCAACTASFTTSEHGSTSSDDCICPTNAYAPVGANNCICKPGAFMNTSDNTCRLCEQGTFKESGGSSGGCTACNTLYSTQSAGSTSRDECKCDTGLFLNELNQCEECPVKSYNPKVGAQGIEECLDCPYRFFQPTAGQSMCIPLFVDLKSPIEQYGRVVGLFVDGDTSCAYISRTARLTDTNKNNERTETFKICWGLLTSKHLMETILDIPPIKRSCGDGILHPTLEQCDDGNVWNGDGCSDTCQLEDGFLCEARVTTANITESLLHRSTCCRISNSPASHTPKCRRCGSRPAPFKGSRFRTRDCDLVDVNECIEGTDACAAQTGGVVCVNHDAIANNGSILFSCDCPPGKFMSDGICINERFATRFVLSMDLQMNQVARDSLKRYIADEAYNATGRIHTTDMVEVRVDSGVLGGGVEQVTCTLFVESWTAMQHLTSMFNMTRLMERLRKIT